MVVMFFFKKKRAYEIRVSLVGAEICVRERVRKRRKIIESLEKARESSES